MVKDMDMVVFKYPNGDRYEGNYRNDKREGIGTYFHANGSKHTGYYKNGKYNGYGIYILKMEINI